MEITIKCNECDALQTVDHDEDYYECNECGTDSLSIIAIDGDEVELESDIISGTNGSGRLEDYLEYVNHVGDDTLERFEDNLRGVFDRDSEKDESLVDMFLDSRGIPEDIIPYLDTDLIARDMRYDFYDFTGTNGKNYLVWAY